MAGVSKQRRLTDAERAKAESCVRLAWSLSNGTINEKGLHGEVTEAVYDKAVDGLLYAATAHDPARGTMKAVASYAVRGYIRHALTKAEKAPGVCYPDFDRLYPDRGRRWNGRPL